MNIIYRLYISSFIQFQLRMHHTKFVTEDAITTTESIYVENDQIWTPSLCVIWLSSSAWSRSPPTRAMQGHRHRCTRSPRDHVMELPRRRHHIIVPSHHRRLLRAALGHTAVRIYLTTIWIWITRPLRRTRSKEGRGGGAEKGGGSRSRAVSSPEERNALLSERGRECRWGRESELGFVAAYMGFTAGAYVEVLGKQRWFSPLVSLWTGSDIFSPSVQ